MTIQGRGFDTWQIPSASLSTTVNYVQRCSPSDYFLIYADSLASDDPNGIAPFFVETNDSQSGGNTGTEFVNGTGMKLDTPFDTFRIRINAAFTGTLATFVTVVTARGFVTDERSVLAPGAEVVAIPPLAGAGRTEIYNTIVGTTITTNPPPSPYLVQISNVGSFPLQWGIEDTQEYIGGVYIGIPNTRGDILNVGERAQIETSNTIFLIGVTSPTVAQVTYWER